MTRSLKPIFMMAALMCGMSVQAQNWREMISDPKADFRETQAAFYAEFGDEVGGKGTGWKQFKRWEWFMQQRLSEDGKMPNPKLVYEEVKRADMQKRFRGTSGDWQLLGPINEPSGTVGYQIEGIGRLSALEFHPTDTNVMWAGAPSGGMWKTVDNGQWWEPLTDDLLNIGVAEIVVNPHHPDTMFLASGDGSVSDTYTYGVMRSTDGGQTWDTTGLSFDVTAGRNIRRLLIDSSNTQVLIAATTNGIYRTTDAGDTWTMVQSGNFADLEFKPFANDTVYASTNSSSAPPFFISTDNGVSWTASTTGMNVSEMVRVKLAVSPAAPDLIYALASADDQGLHGIYRSTDAGATWELRATSPNLLTGDEFGQNEGGQGWYSMDLAVSPLNPDEVKVGGINIWESNDGGANFTLEAHWTGANGTYVHADQHRHLYHPITGQFHVACDGGLFRRSYYFNGFEIVSSGMSITQFYRLSTSYTNEGILLAGAQDNGTMRWREGNWIIIYGGDGMESMIHPDNPLIMYCTTQNGNLYKSTDGGNTFSDDISPAGGAWVTPYMMEPGEPSVLYAAEGSHVYRSDDGGSDWWEFSPVLTTLSSGELTLLDVAHSNTEYVVAGSNRTLRITTDLGGTWTNIMPGLPTNNLTYVAFDPLDENTLWVTVSGYTEGRKVYRSRNAGQTWENMSMNLPNLPVNCVEIERSSTGGVYVGTDVGIYYWDHNLSEWEPFMTGLPNVIVNELEIHEPTNTLRAATYGRGLWESPTRNFINVGMEELGGAQRPAVSIWPNPASDHIQIAFVNPAEASDLLLLDAYGRTVLRSLNPSGSENIRIGIRDLSTGVYYLADMDHRPIGRFIVNR